MDKYKEKKGKKSGFRLPRLMRHQVSGVLLVALAILILLSLVSFDRIRDRYVLAQIDWDHISSLWEMRVPNQGGIVGAYVAANLYRGLGLLAFFVPLYLGLWGVSLILQRRWLRFYQKVTLILCACILLASIIALPQAGTGRLSDETITLGGRMSDGIAHFFTGVLGIGGSVTILSALFLVTLMVLIPVDWLKLLPNVKVSMPARPKIAWHTAPLRWQRYWEKLKNWGRVEVPKEGASQLPPLVLRERTIPCEPMQPVFPPVDSSQKSPRGVTKPGKDDNQEELNLFSELKNTLKVVKGSDQPRESAFQFPTIDLLSPPSALRAISRDELEQTAQALKHTLETFSVHIEGESIEAYPGPVITRFEFKPAPGIKVGQIMALADDLALAMQAKRIRIIAPIPGKAAVGVEIPNRTPQIVCLREIISSSQYQRSDWRLPLALGKTISGEPFVADLARMPHLLIAGATGSGKSVCLNVIITSLLYRLHPDLLRFVFIDPKMLELSIYQGIPHLQRPVVTTPRQAEKILAEAVNEMEERYRQLAQASVRNIEDYNAKKKRLERLPYLVIIVDELADLMMSTNSSRTEMLITRLAQMARAVGIHLILATQRPSVDVITGLIKANFSARLAFQVASKVDSRTILDANGAEKLLGAGDMLFLMTGHPEPIRIHGAYISGAETEILVSFLKAQKYEPVATESFISRLPEVEQNESEEEEDALFREAVELVIRHRQGSVSLLQRRLGIGYQRAARLIDQLEAAGIVGPFEGSKSRDVLVDKSYLERYGAQSNQTQNV